MSSPVPASVTRHRRLRLVLPGVLGLLLVLAGCGSREPWEDRRREAGTTTTVGASTPDKPVFCHAGGEDRAVLDQMAARQCAQRGKTAHFIGQERYQCRLLTPHRSYYECR